MNEELRKINIDIVVFFLLVVSTGISFYLVNEKKKRLLHKKCLSENEENNIYHINRTVILIIAIYFVINSYNSFKESPNNTNDKLIFYASIAALISAYLFYQTNSSSSLIDY